MKQRDLNGELSARLDKAGVRHYSEPIYRVSVSRFYKALTKGKAAQKTNGWMVDRDAKKAYSGMKLYLSRDGKAGMAISKDGNVHSLFSAGSKGGAMGSLIPFAIAHGARKLDCYVSQSGRSNLADMYARYGAKATGKVKFVGEYNDEYMALPDDHPDKVNPPKWVVAMTLPRTLERAVDQYDREARANIKSVKTFRNYDRMLNDRDRQLDGKGSVLPNMG